MKRAFRANRITLPDRQTDAVEEAGISLTAGFGRRFSNVLSLFGLHGVALLFWLLASSSLHAQSSELSEIRAQENALQEKKKLAIEQVLKRSLESARKYVERADEEKLREIMREALKAEGENPSDPLEAQIIRTTVAHYVAGLVGKRELLNILAHFERVLKTAAPATAPVPPVVAAQPQKPENQDATPPIRSAQPSH